ncbi:MAG: SigE family RNA polymerase sigma factor [Nocardiopsaceae bacterium]|jgi:RNA polymerase sigma-70 factor (sigma-E family)|nr:SigE family RNA polymerase sigma factor [Nocardiopsaceae bacterium]
MTARRQGQVASSPGAAWSRVTLSALAREEEFTQFVVDALPRLLRFAHLLTGSPAGAEDLVQTALARSWHAWLLRRIDDPHAFVRRVMVNCYATSRRGFVRWESAYASPPDVSISVDESDRVDDRDALRRALLALPPRQRTVIVLRYYEDLSELEIAGLMGTSPGTVKSQASRALRRLNDLLRSEDAVGQPCDGARHD